MSTGFTGNALGTYTTAPPAYTNQYPITTSEVEICSLTPGAAEQNSAAAVSLAKLGSTGAIATSVRSSLSSGVYSTVSRSAISTINVLGGTITADNLTAVSTASFTGSGYLTSSSGSSFTNLKLSGSSYGSNPPPNTTVTFPNFGYLVLNEQRSVVTGGSAAMYLTMIHVYITVQNTFNIPVGSEIVVGSANAGILPALAFLNGASYAAAAQGNGLSVLPVAAMTMACGGSGGVVQTSSLASLNVARMMTLGAMTTTQQGAISLTSISGQDTSNILSINILNGLITATALTSQTGVALNSTSVALSDTGSLFTNLIVAGHPEVGSNPPANTQIEIANLGTLYLHRIVESPNWIEVRMIELIVTQKNSFSLPVGAIIRVGDAISTAIVP